MYIWSQVFNTLGLPCLYCITEYLHDFIDMLIYFLWTFLRHRLDHLHGSDLDLALIFIIIGLHLIDYDPDKLVVISVKLFTYFLNDFM